MHNGITIGKPIVSIGLPVYNGEKFIVETIESLLAQSFEDFELIIADNASTDATPDICKSFAARDPRIRYVSAEKNRGAAWNYNRAFELSTGHYFKWAADDDIHAPTFLEQCVSVLDSQSDVVLCFARTVFIGEDGEFLREYKYPIDVSTASQRELFRQFIAGGHIVHEVFGLVRSDVLRTTQLIRGFVGSDVTLLGELALRGRFFQIPDVLFFHREHSGRSAMKSAFEYTHWFDTSFSGKRVFSRWRRFAESVRSIWRAPKSTTRKFLFMWDVVRVANWSKSALWRELRQIFSAK